MAAHKITCHICGGAGVVARDAVEHMCPFCLGFGATITECTHADVINNDAVGDDVMDLGIEQHMDQIETDFGVFY